MHLYSKDGTWHVRWDDSQVETLVQVKAKQNSPIACQIEITGEFIDQDGNRHEIKPDTNRNPEKTG